jgi:hypothetical protein
MRLVTKSKMTRRRLLGPSGQQGRGGLRRELQYPISLRPRWSGRALRRSTSSGCAGHLPVYVPGKRAEHIDHHIGYLLKIVPSSSAESEINPLFMGLRRIAFEPVYEPGLGRAEGEPVVP